MNAARRIRNFQLGYFGDDTTPTDPAADPSALVPLPPLTVLPSVMPASSTDWTQIAIFGGLGALAFTLLGGLFVGPGVSSAMRSRRRRKISTYQKRIRSLKASGI